MTLTELLTATATGNMPRVIYNGKIGQVTTIKRQAGGYCGIAVRFDKNYDEWFHAAQGTDRRMKYMADLILVTEIPFAANQAANKPANENLLHLTIQNKNNVPLCFGFIKGKEDYVLLIPAKSKIEYITPGASSIKEFT